jgi:hypothetical protein
MAVYDRNDERLKSVKKQFSRPCERVDITDLRSYNLRHTFATRFLERGVPHYVIRLNALPITKAMTSIGRLTGAEPVSQATIQSCLAASGRHERVVGTDCAEGSAHIPLGRAQARADSNR